MIQFSFLFLFKKKPLFTSALWLKSSPSCSLGNISILHMLHLHRQEKMHFCLAPDVYYRTHYAADIKKIKLTVYLYMCHLSTHLFEGFTRCCLISRSVGGVLCCCVFRKRIKLAQSFMSFFKSPFAVKETHWGKKSFKQN